LRLRGDYLAIVTLGFGEIVRLFMNNLDRPINITNGPQGINNIDGMHIASWQFNDGFQIAGYSFTSEYAYYYLFAFLLLIIIGISIRLENSRIGRAWVAIREDEVAAVAMGINTRNLKLLAFAMGASFGGLAGGLFASFQSYISPESFTLMESIMILCMVVLGGMGNIWGVLLGAFLLTVSPEFLRSVIVPLQREMLGRIIIDPENLRMLLFGLALIAMMLFRPAGLWPARQRQHELENRHD
jgi:branched-chain amino acid transport system permease protein